MVQISIPKEYEKSRELVAVPKRDYIAMQTRARVFTRRPLVEVGNALRQAHPNHPELIADILNGLKRSSLYAKRSAATR